MVRWTHVPESGPSTTQTALDRFIRFCTAPGRGQQTERHTETDIQTDHATPFAGINRICTMHAPFRNNLWNDSRKIIIMEG